ncbi:SlyX family protein [Pelotalea chapellei]|uniref:SlyX family protein n=1 Tax=Pelotalea chapellei TaxID=44671 RepID=A0ABS5UC08_9BACT|nr:SlyX family protein [Pelotalea chapellei]MBT1073183.1 SlyX family protein [Pelotalea chapellei]
MKNNDAVVSPVSAGENLEERVTELELRFMHQERSIQELNEAVYRQEQIIARLERGIGLLNEQFSTLAPPVTGESVEEERPPHY